LQVVFETLNLTVKEIKLLVEVLELKAMGLGEVVGDGAALDVKQVGTVELPCQVVDADVA
jgi:hypothetical protein